MSEQPRPFEILSSQLRLKGALEWGSRDPSSLGHQQASVIFPLVGGFYSSLMNLVEETFCPEKDGALGVCRSTCHYSQETPPTSSPYARILRWAEPAAGPMWATRERRKRGPGVLGA